GGALFFLAAYVFIVAKHLAYPYEIEWMEGGVVDAVHHILGPGRLYEAPTVEYTPFIYAPLFFWVSAALSAVLGEGLFTLRLLSFVCSLGATALVAVLVHKETRSALFSFLAAALFLATYRAGIGFLDLARVDSMFVLLLLAMVYVLRWYPSRRGQIAAAALGALAFLTKQSAVFVVGALAFGHLAFERRRGLPFALAAPAFGALAFLALNVFYGGWAYYYLFWIPRQHPSHWEEAYLFWTDDLLRPLSIVALAALAYVALGEGKGRRVYGAALVGALVMGVQGRVHAGGWANVEIPLFAVLAVTGSIGLHTFAERAAQGRGRAVALAAVAAQLAMLAYDPRKSVPTIADRAAGDQLLESLRKVDGPVFLPAHGDLLVRAGKEPIAQEMAMNDVIGIGGGRPGAALRKELLESFKHRRYDVVVLDTEFMKREVEQSYKRKRDVFTSRDVFFTISGMRTRPRTWYVPK
ncbi:MAG TPA: glycosyltransferase family 39 protein, partial [Byssovorax sp.]